MSRFISAGQRALTDDRPDDAAREFRAALKLAPALLPVHLALGAALTKAGRHEDAARALGVACDMAPANYELRMALADALYLGGQLAAALPEYLRATQLNPNAVVPWSNVGAIYLRGGDPHQALRALHHALSIDPRYPQALGNSGLAFVEVGDLALARECFDAAIAANADYSEAHWNRAILDLMHGNFERGWAGHEYRWVQVASSGSVRSFTEPRWNGQRFDGQTLLLWAEQGLGDQLQFVRFLPLVKALGGTVILQCSPSLKDLLAHSCPAADEVVTSIEEAGAFDLQAPIMSLPHLLNVGSNVGGERVPYLHAPTVMANAIALALPEPHQQVRAGIIWAGQPRHQNDRNRSMSLETLRPLLDVPHVEWYAVQKGDAAEAQLDAFNAQSTASGAPAVTPLGALFNSFADTAQAIARLDVVLTVDTAVAHLAGAMGIPVWLMIPFVPDWRWQLDRHDSPWYPGARIFRQAKVGDWSNVIAEVALAMTELGTTRRVAQQGERPRATVSPGASLAVHRAA